MRGSIYSEQKCSLCGGKLVHDENRSGLFCLKHSEEQATGKFIVRFGRKLTKRFSSYNDAERFLTGIRYETDRGSFDIRDYQSTNPLSFENLSRKWLQIKKSQVRPSSFRNIRNYINKAAQQFGNRNIKTIKYSDLQELFLAQKCSSKTLHDMKTWLKQFFKWVEDCEEKFRSPKFPEVKYEIGWRNIIDKETQSSIIAEIKRISYDYNPKIWLGIRWLSIYVKMRPVEMLRIKEKHINVNGCLIIPPDSTKERNKPKIIPLLPEDIELIKSLPNGFPDQHFFRHGKVKGHKEGTPFGKGFLWIYWKKACENLGITGVDLYGGTRHSTVTFLAQHFSRDEIKEHGTGHDTSKAFERYMQAEASKSLNIYRKASEQHSDNIISVDFSKNNNDVK